MYVGRSISLVRRPVYPASARVSADVSPYVGRRTQSQVARILVARTKPIIVAHPPASARDKILLVADILTQGRPVDQGAAIYRKSPSTLSSRRLFPSVAKHGLYVAKARYCVAE